MNTICTIYTRRFRTCGSGKKYKNCHGRNQQKCKKLSIFRELFLDVLNLFYIFSTKSIPSFKEFA
ncbi:MAG: SEC-C domain-containing protein [Clostridia bacterium]|nr:SEC-C domain-containing protein [Clostridia bacterium]